MGEVEFGVVPGGSGGRSRRWFGNLIVALLVVVAGLLASGLVPFDRAEANPGSVQPASSGAASGLPTTGPSNPPPSLAYYYIWFNAQSWTHTKLDLPILGGYTSTDPGIIRQHVTWAKEAGLDALIVSWKSSPSLNLALSELVAECRRQDMKLVLIYQGLDVNRNPIPVETVEADLVWFEQQYGQDSIFDLYGKPAIIWSGTWRFSDSDIAAVRNLIGAPDKVLLLGSEKSAGDYQERASLFDGDAYYWSSADPLSTPGYQSRIDSLANAVHAAGGLWLAPAAAGFDAQLNGGTSSVDRRNGVTLTTAWSDALKTHPDGVALISWNEFTENSFVEPSQAYGYRYLDVLRLLTGAASPIETLPPSTPSPIKSAAPGAPTTAPASSVVAAATSNRPAPGRGSPFDIAGSVLVLILGLAILVYSGLRLRSRGARVLGTRRRGGPTPGSQGRPA